jgi:hypothetical protein
VKDDDYSNVQRSLAIWEGPANAKFAEFLGLFTKEEVVMVTIREPCLLNKREKWYLQERTLQTG